MIVAFDLDDTLYRELDFVESGLLAVASHVSDTYDVDAVAALAIMHRSLEQHGRGRQFDDLLKSIGAFTRRRRDRLVQVYRTHQPDIQLPPESDAALDAAAAGGHRLFLVTDGNKLVQANKVTALGLWGRFEHVYLTGRYGNRAAKPSPIVFEFMLRRTGIMPSDLVYIADDPSKDFFGVRSLGGRTIRVLTGQYARASALPGFDADATVESITAAVASVNAVTKW